MSTIESKPETGAYFYPLTTKCPEQRARARSFGTDPSLSEMKLCRQAKPMFEGHQQPKTYCLGESRIVDWDDTEPATLIKQIELARSFGLSFFVFDTYIGCKDGKVVRESIQPLDTFCDLDNKQMKFALMFCLGGPRAVFPVPREREFIEPGRYFDLSPETARAIIDDCAKKYWDQENYLLINNRPYISLFPSGVNLASPEKKKASLKTILEEMREHAWRQYQIEPYIVGVVRKYQSTTDACLFSQLIDGSTGYAFLPDFDQNHDQPIQDYEELLSRIQPLWQEIRQVTQKPFVPSTLVGWDASPRGEQGYMLDEVIGCYPYTPVLVENSPASFQKMLEQTLDFVSQNVASPQERYGLVCAWNEIGEGNALLPQIRPDQTVDFSYLKAIKTATSS